MPPALLVMLGPVLPATAGCEAHLGFTSTKPLKPVARVAFTFAQMRAQAGQCSVGQSCSVGVSVTLCSCMDREPDPSLLSMEPLVLGLSWKDTERTPLGARPGVRGVRGVRGARALLAPPKSRDGCGLLGRASEVRPLNCMRSGAGSGRGVRGVAGALLSAAEAERAARERVLAEHWCSRAGTQAPSRNTSSTTLQGRECEACGTHGRCIHMNMPGTIRM